MRLLRWPGPDEESRSKRPYRDAALVYAGMAAVVVVLAVLTGGGFGRAVVFAAAAFVVAIGWTWLHLWRRGRSEDEA